MSSNNGYLARSSGCLKAITRLTRTATAIGKVNNLSKKRGEGGEGLPREKRKKKSPFTSTQNLVSLDSNSASCRQTVLEGVLLQIIYFFHLLVDIMVVKNLSVPGHGCQASLVLDNK